MLSFSTYWCVHLLIVCVNIRFVSYQILIGDSERLREELADVVRERDGLRLKMGMLENKGDGTTSDGIDSAPSSGGGVKLAEFMSERRAYEAEIGELSDTCNALREELKSKEEAIADDRRCVGFLFVCSLRSTF